MTTMVTLTAPAGLTGMVQTEYGNYQIEDGQVTVDGRAVLPLLDAGFSSPDLPDLKTLPDFVELEVPASWVGASHDLQTQYGNYEIQGNTVTVPKKLVPALIAQGLSLPPVVAGGGGAELAFMDFQNGVYRMSGSVVPLSDMWAGVTGVVPGEGLTRSAASSELYSTDAMAALLNLTTTGFVAVMDCFVETIDGTGTYQSYGIAGFGVIDNVNYNDQWWSNIEDRKSTSAPSPSKRVAYLTSYAHAELPAGIDAGNNHKEAFLYKPGTEFAASWDGQPVVTAAPAAGPVATHAYFTVYSLLTNATGKTTIRSIKFLPPVASADLVALSAL